MISGRGKGEKGHTPLDCLEDAGLERLGEAGVQGAGLLMFAFYSLEIVQAAFAGDLALELPETIEGHACSEDPKKKCLKGGWRTVEKDALIGLEDLAGFLEVEDLTFRICLESMDEVLGGFCEDDAFTATGRHGLDGGRDGR